jgi:hypothetical protein
VLHRKRRQPRTGAAVGEAHHEVRHGVLALPLLAAGRRHVPLKQLNDLLLRDLRENYV